MYTKRLKTEIMSIIPAMVGNATIVCFYVASERSSGRQSLRRSMWGMSPIALLEFPFCLQYPRFFCLRRLILCSAKLVRVGQRCFKYLWVKVCQMGTFWDNTHKVFYPSSPSEANTHVISPQCISIYSVKHRMYCKIKFIYQNDCIKKLEIYRKIPNINPGLLSIFKHILVGLYSGGLYSERTLC